MFINDAFQQKKEETINGMIAKSGSLEAFFHALITSTRYFTNLGPVSRKSRNFSGDKNLFVSSIGTHFVL